MTPNHFRRHLYACICIGLFFFSFLLLIRRLVLRFLLVLLLLSIIHFHIGAVLLRTFHGRLILQHFRVVHGQHLNSKIRIFCLLKMLRHHILFIHMKRLWHTEIIAIHKTHEKLFQRHRIQQRQLNRGRTSQTCNIPQQRSTKTITKNRIRFNLRQNPYNQLSGDEILAIRDRHVIHLRYASATRWTTRTRWTKLEIEHGQTLNSFTKCIQF
mmetsp:Transcript_23950/g.38492  ORF Transcript_23950/g.38492 Transcript_23950/m.38492 type:complete len:212 (-) Transcript_23950:715-1350(-)